MPSLHSTKVKTAHNLSGMAGERTASLRRLARQIGLSDSLKMVTIFDCDRLGGEKTRPIQVFATSGARLGIGRQVPEPAQLESMVVLAG